MNLTIDIYQRIATAKIFIVLEEISQQAYLSRFQFHRLFTKIYRSTPHRYLTQKRIEKAKQLLAENKAINDVCSEVGFESIGSFSTLFKKEIGFAPTLYRNIAWLKKLEQKKQPRKFIPHCFIESYALDK